MTPIIYLIIYLGLTVFFSFVALIAYFRDKKLEARDKRIVLAIVSLCYNRHCC